MNKQVITIALSMLCGTWVQAQGTTTNSTTTTKNDPHCLAQADDHTWSNLGLNEDQITRVKEIQTRYQAKSTMDRGTENTMRGTSDDKATPVGTDHTKNSSTSTT